MGFKLLPEWAVQSGIMLTWPHKNTWGGHCREAEITFTSMVKAISIHEKALISYFDDSHQAHILDLLKAKGVNLSKIIFAKVKSDDIWIRDHGPLTVRESNSGALKLLNFSFNAWGGKYAHDNDKALSLTLHAQGHFDHVPIELIDFILEGGAIEVDGEGSLLTTESVMLTPTRNQLSKLEIESLLMLHFGIDRILWITHGSLLGDDTDGHVDTLARFLDSQTICFVDCNDSQDPHYAPLKKMKVDLEAFKTKDGAPYRLIPLPLPDPQFSTGGERLPATYANFLFLNEALLLPIYGVKQDALAVEIFKSFFPMRQVHAIDCRALINYYGSLHCATMQLPQGVLR